MYYSPEIGGVLVFFKKKGEFCYTVRRAQPGSAHLTSPQSVVLHSLHVVFKRVSNPKAPDDARFLTILYRVDPLQWSTGKGHGATVRCFTAHHVGNQLLGPSRAEGWDASRVEGTPPLLSIFFVKGSGS